MAMTVSIPYLARLAIDRAIQPGDDDLLFPFAALVVGAGVLQAIGIGVRRYYGFKLSYRVEADLRNRIFEHIQRQAFSFHDHTSTGQLMARASSDLSQVRLILAVLPISLASVGMFLLVVLALVLIDPVLGTVASLTVPLLLVTVNRYSSRTLQLSFEVQESLADLSQVVEESVGGIQVVKAYGQEPQEQARLDQSARKIYERSFGLARHRSVFSPLFEAIPAAGTVAVLWIGGLRVIDGALTAGEFVAFTLYLSIVLMPLRVTGWFFANIPRAAAAASRVDDLLAAAPEIADPVAPGSLPEGPGEIEFSGVGFSYSGGPPVLAEVDLTIAGGTAVALVGATGSGKTTLAHLIPRFRDASEGAIRVDGVDVRSVTLDELRREIAVVFQETFLFSASVRENISVGDPVANDSQVRAAARLAQAHDFICRLPEAYDTVVGERGHSLSGGQRQRVALARAVLRDPRILILDDATSSVDAVVEAEIQAALRRVMVGRTTIVIAHRTSTLALVDSVIFIEDGRVAATGTHEELLATVPRYGEILARGEGGTTVAGDYDVKARGKLLKRAGGVGRHLALPALGALLVTVVATIARLLGPLVVRSGLDDGVVAGNRSVVTRAAVVFLGLLMFQYAAQLVSQRAVAWVGERFLLEFRSRVYAHILRLDMAFFDRSKTGVLVSRMTSDIEALTDFVNEGAVMALTNVLTAFGVAVVMLFVDVELALYVFVLIAVLIAVSVVFQRYASKAYGKVRERIGRVLALLQEGIAGVREVQAFTQQPQQAGTFGRINERYVEANMQAARAISWYFPSVAWLRTIGIGLVLAVGGLRVIDGDLTFGSLVAFLMFLEWFFQPIINLAQVYNLLQASLAALAKLFGLLDTQAAVRERPGAYDLPTSPSGALTLRHVSFAYEPGTPVLEDVDLEITAGQRLAVVGETGAGKSTIAKLLMRFYDPSSGSLAIDGHDLRNLSNRSRSAAMTLIPQEDFLFNGTLRDNFKYGKPDASDTEIWDVCRAMGIAEWVGSLPEGLDTEVRERGSRFSAGERQLVALGRAFLVDPSIIVLDEATSSLDPETEMEVEGALRVLLAGRTAVVIAHRLRSAERAERVLFVHDGRIESIGSHTELIEASGRYRELVSVWERGLA
jgi:ATP-binding cassette subfamily B protein